MPAELAQRLRAHREAGHLDLEDIVAPELNGHVFRGKPELLGALLHASWNALVKSGSDQTLDTALVHTAMSLIALPLALYVGLPERAAWPYITTSLVIHIGYYIALAGAYRYGELSMTYPIMRGFAPLLVALASTSVIGESPSAAAWAGILGITVGVALVGLAHPGEALHHRKALGFAFANAAIIAVYTFVDEMGARTEQRLEGSVAGEYVPSFSKICKLCVRAGLGLGLGKVIDWYKKVDVHNRV